MRGEGALYACDKSEEALATARRYWARAGVEGIVKEKFGDAKESVREDDVCVQAPCWGAARRCPQ